MDDRRKFFRFETPVNLKYSPRKAGIKKRSQTKNISKEGVAFSANKKLRKKKKLQMEFEIPGDNIPVFAQGAVMWSKEDEATTSRKKVFNVGIKLTNITNLDRSRILDYAYEQWLKLKNIRREA